MIHLDAILEGRGISDGMASPVGPRGRFPHLPRDTPPTGHRPGNAG
jgi:hypothetical protein